jgi:hypothetical protein
MFTILYAFGMVVADLVKLRAQLEAKILLLLHQLNIALRHVPPRVRLLCVPKSLSTLIKEGNRLTSAGHDRAGLLHLERSDLAVQIGEPA